MKTAMVWSFPCPTGPLEYGAHIGTQPLPQLIEELGVMWWQGDRVAAAVGHYDCYIVNLFPNMQHVTQIRAKQPDAFIIALPDAYMDEVFLNRDAAQEAQFIEQLQAADVIGYVSHSNHQFYRVFGKRMIYFPIVVGTPEFFSDVRKADKEDFIIACDHTPRAVDYSIQNVAALALIQQETGVRVVYCNAAPNTALYAEKLGLKAEFQPHTVYENFVRLAARARLGVDLYARYGVGRNELTLAYAGTPCMGSTYTDGVALKDLKVDPWHTRKAADWAIGLLGNDILWEDAMRRGLEQVEASHSFQTVRNHWPYLAKEIEVCHSAR